MKRWDHTREKRGGGKQGLTLLAVTVLMLSLLTTGVLAFFSGRSNELTNTFTEKPEITYTLYMRLNYDVSDQTIWQTLTANSREDSYSFTLPNEAPTREGYTFLGWSGYREGEPPYQPGGKVTAYESNPAKNIYAIWEEANTYTVTLDANGGTAGSVTQLTYTGAEDSYAFTLPSAEGDGPTMENGVFLGWSEDKHAITPTYLQGKTFTLRKEEPEATLYAVWDVPLLKDGQTFNALLTDYYDVIFGAYADYADAVSGLSYSVADEDGTGAYRVYVDDSKKVNYVLSMVGGGIFRANSNCEYMLRDMGTGVDTGYIQGLGLLDMRMVSNIDYLFRSSRLKSIELPAWDLGQVTEISGLFSGSVMSKDENSLFGTISGLENLKGPNLTSLTFLFSGCTVTESLDIEDLDISGIKNIQSMFYYFLYLQRSDKVSSQVANALRNWDTSGITNMRGLFQSSSLEVYDMVEGWDTSKVTDMNCLFDNLKISGPGDLDLSGWDVSNVKDFSCMFRDCGLTVHVSNWTLGNSQIETRYMFSGYSGGTSLDLSGWNTQYVVDMYRMFYNTTMVETIYVGDGWSTASVSNSILMLHYCTNLVGGNGTTWNASNPTDKTYARVDKPGQPGYFTYKAYTP